MLKILSLREVEQLFAKINLVIKSTAKNDRLYPELLAFLIIAKEYYPDHYNDYIYKGDTPEKLISDLHGMIPESERLSNYATLEGCLIAAKYDHYNTRTSVGDSLKRHDTLLKSRDSNEEQKNYSSDVMDTYKHYTQHGSRINLDSLKQRIELSESLKFSS